MFGAISQIDDGNWHHIAVTWNQIQVLLPCTSTVDMKRRRPERSGGDISHTGDITLGYGVSPTTGMQTYFEW